MEESTAKSKTTTANSTNDSIAALIADKTSSPPSPRADANGASAHREPSHESRNGGRNFPGGDEKATRANSRSSISDYDIPLTDKPGLQGYLELIQRRLSGDYEIDEFGADPLYGQMWWPIFEQIYRNYWRVETTGVEHVPDAGRAIIAANHSGGSYAWDAVMMSTAIHLEHPRPRYVHYVATEFFFDMPFLSYDNRKKNAALACRDDFSRLLARDLLVGVFPEGAKGFLKPNDKRYRVQRFGRGGFVEIALATGAPIVPVAVVGGEEIHFSLGNSKTLAKLLNRMIPQERADSFPIMLNMIPLPIKWRIEFCEPIDVSSYGPEAARDPIQVQQITEQVRARIQEALDRNLTQRRTMFW
jgi:1-acyl-sn-glycerol-3-phosphate acyltransferase